MLSQFLSCFGGDFPNIFHQLLQPTLTCVCGKLIATVFSLSAFSSDLISTSVISGFF